MNKPFEYSVAIRTLGQAGDLFYQELESLMKQTIPPNKILVYIAEGYPIPKRRIGYEEYIYVPKGMVAQRALPYNEVDTDYLLQLDDDIFLPPNTVKKLYRSLIEHQADCISPDIFITHELSVFQKMRAFITNMVFPRFDQKWAFKIHSNASFSYANCPKSAVLPSQSAAGAVALWKMSTFKAIHFSDERWLDEFTFAYGEDLLMFHKLYKNGFKLIVHYKTNILHLDGKSARKNYNNNLTKFKLRSQLHFILWWRICYNLANISRFKKSIAIFSYSCKFLLALIVHTGYSIVRLNFQPFKYFIQGQIEGWKYVHSQKYRKIPNFILSKKS